MTVCYIDQATGFYSWKTKTKKTYRYVFQLFLTPGVKVGLSDCVSECETEWDRQDVYVCVCVSVCTLLHFNTK